MIYFYEFLSIKPIKLNNTDEEDLIEIFKIFDRDESGYIAPEEIRHALTNLEEKFSDEEINEMMREVNELLKIDIFLTAS